MIKFWALNLLNTGDYANLLVRKISLAKTKQRMKEKKNRRKIVVKDIKACVVKKEEEKKKQSEYIILVIQMFRVCLPPERMILYCVTRYIRNLLKTKSLSAIEDSLRCRSALHIFIADTLQYTYSNEKNKLYFSDLVYVFWWQMLA